MAKLFGLVNAFCQIFLIPDGLLYWGKLTVTTAVTQNLGKGASSLSLFVLGLNLSHVRINREQLNKNLLFVILAKNILHPVTAMLWAYYIFHLEGIG